MIKPSRRAYLFFVLALFAGFLSGCLDKKEVSLDQEDFQKLITEGFSSPRIVTVDLPASARAHLYLRTPEIEFADSRRMLHWRMPGEVDMDFARFSSGRMPVTLKGTAELKFSSKEQAVFFENVKIASHDIQLESGLIQMLVLDALAEIVAKRFDNMLLFTVAKDSPLAELVKADAVTYRIEPERIVFQVQQD